MTRGYTTVNLVEDLKLLFKLSGGAGKSVTFLLTDNDVKDDSFLEYINNILTVGEVPGLFPRDELDGILSDLQQAFRRECGRMVADTPDNLYRFFVDRVRRNLHLVLCFSPVGDKLRNRSLKFPGIITGCTIDWFRTWPDDALASVARRYLEGFEVECSPVVKERVYTLFATIHLGVVELLDQYATKFRRRRYVTPAAFLSVLNLYCSLYQSRRDRIDELAARMNLGLNKLREASENVADLRVDLESKEVELQEAQARAAAQLEEITRQTFAAEQQKAEVHAVSERIREEALAIKKDKEEAEADLAEAAPLMERATVALNQIKPSDINVVKKMPHPPNLLQRILDGVLILRRLPLQPVRVDPSVTRATQLEPSWKESVRMMSDQFLYSLLYFKKNQINDETIELLQPYFEMEDWTYDSVVKSSGNVLGLYSWIVAMASYHEIYKVVQPKVELVNRALVEHAEAQSRLAEAEGEVRKKEEEVHRMQERYSVAVSHNKKLHDDYHATREKMATANALIEALGGERERWTEQSLEFADTRRRLVGDVAVAVLYVSYGGPLNQEFRQTFLDMVHRELDRDDIPSSGKELNITSSLASDALMSEWSREGLPTDELSVHNAIMLTAGSRYPLLIDPQGQARTWLMQNESTVVVCSMDDKCFRDELERCISDGLPLMIVDVESELDPVLDSVLAKEIVRTGSRLRMRVGGQDILYNPNFKLFAITKLANPTLTPEVCALMNVIDFTVTKHGLEDQLLGRVILKDKAEMELQRISLLEDVAANKARVEELEDQLLVRLTSSTGSLVEDSDLISVLQTMKAAAIEVADKLSTAYETEQKIEMTREEFRPIATRGSILYFLIAEMSLVNHMYQTSLAQFLVLFEDSIDRAERSRVPTRRIENVMKQLTYTTYGYIVRGLFEEHKLMFALQMALKIDMQRKLISEKEYVTFVKGGKAVGDVGRGDKKPFAWLPDSSWYHLQALVQVSPFEDVVENIRAKDRHWKKWYESPAPEREALPTSRYDHISAFQHLLLIRCMCEDRTVFAAKTYVQQLGVEYVEPPPTSLEVAVDEADNHTPLVCLLSIGSDPTSQIAALAKRRKVPTADISMGQGQEVHARRLVEQGMAAGSWVLLQNCHLALPFMTELVHVLCSAKDVHEGFRLWITTEPTDFFPISLLQIAIKLTNEPPRGVKAGLRRTYTGLSQDLLDAIEHADWKPMLYSIAFLHTVVQERRKFGSLGWNVPYEFNQSDFNASVQFVQNLLYESDDRRGISWVNVRYMITEVLYGGRVTDDFDRRLLRTYGEEWLCPDMLEPGFEFHEGYSIPGATTVEEYLRYIDGLPRDDSPEIFGLHVNADIAYRTTEADELLTAIGAVHPKDATGSGVIRDEVLKKVIVELAGRVPAPFTQQMVMSCITSQGGMTIPLNVFLSQEIDAINGVLSLVHDTLTSLSAVFNGTAVMNRDLKAALDALRDGVVPPAWLEISWPSSALSFWLTDLLARTRQYDKWLNEGAPPVMWLSGIFNPPGFLTAVKQGGARLNGWALDEVDIRTEVTRVSAGDVKNSATDGSVCISGLFLEGASWDTRKGLVDPTTKKLCTEMPVLRVSAVRNLKLDENMYQCPVYRTGKRCKEDFIFNVTLKSPTQYSPSFWTLRGVALLTQRED